MEKKLIGIISDTHDNIDAIEKAVDIFNQKDVSLVIHAGDYISPFALERFSRLNADFQGVFGNNDGEKNGLKKKASTFGSDIEDLKEITYERKKIAVYHGTIDAIINALEKSNNYDIIIRGHNHIANQKTVNGTLVINPGEACGYLYEERTLSILNIETMKVELIKF